MNHIQDVFAALTDRIYFYESGNYLKQTYAYSLENEFLSSQTDYSKITTDINKNVDYFSAAEVCGRINFYIIRLQDIIPKLKVPESVWLSYTDIEDIEDTFEIKLDDAQQTSLLEDFKIELETYVEQLKLIAKVREQFIVPDASSKDGEISIPIEIESDTENEISTQPSKKFSTRELKSKLGFKSILSTEQIAILISCLRQRKISPDYTDVSLTDIGGRLFGTSPQNIRKHMSAINEVRKEKDHRDELLSILQSIIDDIKSY
jgi:hypothetical protein